jgi:magnesium-transporting ATPase (P-type)
MNTNKTQINIDIRKVKCFLKSSDCVSALILILFLANYFITTFIYVFYKINSSPFNYKPLLYINLPISIILAIKIILHFVGSIIIIHKKRKYKEVYEEEQH